MGKEAKEASPYRVLVRELPTHRRFEVPPARVAEWLKGHAMREALGPPDPDPRAGDGVADLELYAEGTHAFAAGTFKGHVLVACSRCVGEVDLAIDERLRVTFLPPSEMPADDGVEAGQDDGDGAEVDEGDLDLFPFDGETIDLEPLLREQFVLAVPYAPLCREDCKGLCPQCGIDLNSGTCACEPPIDPRLAALKGLKIPS
jgi:uncharacterized protein